MLFFEVEKKSDREVRLIPKQGRAWLWILGMILLSVFGAWGSVLVTGWLSGLFGFMVYFGMLGLSFMFPIGLWPNEWPGRFRARRVGLPSAFSVWLSLLWGTPVRLSRADWESMQVAGKFTSRVLIGLVLYGFALWLLFVFLGRH